MPSKISRAARTTSERAATRLEQLRERVGLVDVAVRIYDRDKEAAGTLLGSALALRLFSFFLPLVLFAVGLAGILGAQLDVASPSDTAGVSGVLAGQIDAAFTQNGATPWIAAGLGLVGMATSGRSLARALTLSSALSWQLGGKQKIPVRIIGVIVGIVVGMALVAAVLNRIRQASGVAVASISFLAVAAIYVVLWSLLFLALPRATTDPSSALPGAAIVAMVLTAMQAITQLYLPRQIESASTLYGTVGVTITFLGWFFFLGRAISLAFSVNAVVYERVGSVSRFVFGLPLIGRLPKRFPAINRFFGLHEADPPDQP